jgi:hypothetical protein
MRLVAVPYSVPLLAQHPLGSRPNEYYRLQNPLPEDAEFVWSYMAPDGRSVYFVFCHESFGDVAQGEKIPEVYLTYESRIFTEVTA